MSEALTGHHGIGRLNAVDDAAQIGVDYLVLGLDGVIAQLAGDYDAGIVENEIETSVLLGDALYQASYALEVRHVEGASGGAPP